MKKKIIAIFIIVLIIMTLSFSVYAETLDEKKQELKDKINQESQKLEYVQEELSTAVKEVEELDDKITEYENKIKDLSNQYDNVMTRLKSTTEDYNKVKDEYEKNETLLEDRLVALYEAGDTTYLDLLLSSGSITDFISNYYLIEQLADYDSQLLSKIENQKNLLEETKKKLEDDKNTLVEIKGDAIKEATALKNSRTVQNAKKEQLTEEERKIQTEIQKYKIEQANVENQIRKATGDTEYDLQYTGGVMLWPVAKKGTVITSPFGSREHPIQGVVKLHTGIDIGAGYGSKVVAAMDGVVSYAGYLGGYGNCVIVNHGSGISTLYGHGQTILTQKGTEVKQGDVIMEVGSTGNSTGPHLHFEVRVNDTAVNPLPYVKDTKQ